MNEPTRAGCAVRVEILQQGPTVKALLSSRGAYLTLDSPEGANQRGEVIQKLGEEDIFDSFISRLPHILQTQDGILQVRDIRSTEFYPKLYEN